ncbi:MAG: DegV family protein [Acutalibacteraceae bacterium]|nr:DegV family protein [Acutalibacteraceae bacterium]
MSKIKIVTDSAADLAQKHEDLYDIEVLPFKITLNDESYTDRTDFTPTEFYGLLDEAEYSPVTEPISAFEFGELYYDLLDQGYTDIIYLSVCGKGSETYKNSVLAREHFFEDNPDAAEKLNIYCIDSGSYSGGYGYAATEAAKMADRGAPAEEIVKFLKDWCKKCVIYFGLYSSKYAKKSEIIDLDSAFVGELLGFRPIMEVREGVISTEATVRREGAILPFLSELCTEEIEAGSPYCILFGNCSEESEGLAALLTSVLGYPPAEVYQIGAVTTCHTGYEAVGVVFKSK